MNIAELRNKAKLIAAHPKTNGDRDKTGKLKLWALWCAYEKTRISPFYTLKEWQGKDLKTVTLNYIAAKNGVTE